MKALAHAAALGLLALITACRGKSVGDDEKARRFPVGPSAPLGDGDCIAFSDTLSEPVFYFLVYPPDPCGA